MIARFASSRYLLASLLLALPLAAQCAEGEGNASQDPVRLLHIGNSFSANATRYLPQLARAGGKKLDLYGATIGGCSLERHAKHLRQAKAGDPEGRAYASKGTLGSPLSEQKKVSLPQVLAAKEWDIVTVQQVSQQSVDPESFEPHASELIAEIRATAPKATLYIHQTWAYRSDSPFYQRGKYKGLNPDRMQELVNRAYAQLAQKHQVKHFLPSGLAVRNANRSEKWRYQPDANFDYVNPPAGKFPAEKSVYLGPTLTRPDEKGGKKFRLDQKHLGPSGCYLAGCVWYEVIFNDSVVNVDFVPPELSPEQAAELRQMAHEAVAEYRAHGLAGAPAKP